MTPAAGLVLPAYIIDTSSLMHVDGEDSSPKLRRFSTEERDRFWRHFVARVDDGRIKTIREVFDEIERNDRRATQELAPRLQKLLVPTTDDFNCVASLLKDERFRGLVRDDAVSEPADPWIICVARRLGLIVVTNEVRTADRKRPDGRARIPDVCGALGIDCIDVVEFARREGLMLI